MVEKVFIKKIYSVLFGSSKTELEIYKKLYYKCLQASRRPEFYTEFEVADTFDGRFDMLCLIVSVLIQKLNQESHKTREFSQLLFDIMFKDIDLTLREMGAGDLGVGKRVKIMSESFMGRLTKYSKSLENSDKLLLADTLSRNLYRQDGKINRDSKICEFVFNFHNKISQLDMDYVISEDFNIDQLIMTCLREVQN